MGVQVKHVRQPRCQQQRLAIFGACSFGQGITLSRIVAAAQAVPGVQCATVERLQRQYEAANHEIDNGILPLRSWEIAQLDNDPSFPEHGALAIVVEGGR